MCAKYTCLNNNLRFADLSLLILASPYVSETDLKACGECPMLILACDGVWDVFSDQEAADLLMEEYKAKGGPFENAAELLVLKSIERGSADNVTAIVVFL